MNNNDKEVTILLAPDAVCVTGDDDLTWIRSGGMIIAKAGTEAEAWFIARYLLTQEERKAALRIHETCKDGQCHDVSNQMMKRLSEKGLVVHKGVGWYEGTQALARLQTFAEAMS